MLRRIYRSPNADMLLNGYYDQPIAQQNGYIQEPQYADQTCLNCGEYGVPNADVPADGNFQQDLLQQNPEQNVQEFITEAPLDVPVTQKLLAKTPKASRNRPNVNFFPVSFGGGIGSGRSEGFSGGTVAIANSYSTGRRGVATSNANAFADPSALANENPRYQSQY